MRLLFVVPRYGVDVAGGAEQASRAYATRLADRDHDVHVLTTRAVTSLGWEDHYPAGDAEIDGVVVHRLTGALRRDEASFSTLTHLVIDRRGPPDLATQEAWVNLQGPTPADLVRWLASHASGFDVVVFFTYLYYPTWAGLAVCAGRVPTVLHPTAHDEAYFWLPVFDVMLRQPTAYAFFTDEEQSLVRSRLGRSPIGGVVGIGADLTARGEPDRWRDGPLGDRPYLLYLGRVTEGKGAVELCRTFSAYKQHSPGKLRLVLMGEVGAELPPDPDIVATGWVDDQTRLDAIAGAAALVQPSHFESFSMVLTEAWAQRRPVLVPAASAVLAGQVRRSGGGLLYDGPNGFASALDQILDGAGYAGRLGDAGRRFVEERYAWDRVLPRYERLLRVARMVR